jgi:hypothetical protein
MKCIRTALLCRENKEGRTLGLGASGFIARKIQEVRKKSRKIEKRRAKAATKPPKQV